jgi:hypothetical protein
MIYLRNVFERINGDLMRKKRKKGKTDQQKPKPEVQPSESKSVETNEDNPFDFGGLPARDLKKNLGCG